MGSFAAPPLFFILLAFSALVLQSCTGGVPPQSSPMSAVPPNSAPPPNPVPPPTSSNTNSMLFGMHIHRIGSGTPWPNVSSLPAWRVWDAHVSWRETEPARGVFDFSLLDSYVSVARQHNTELLLTLGYTPQWASQRPNEPSNGGPGAAAPPADLRDWQDYVTALVNRYKGQIRGYEVLNEPNFSVYFSGTVTDQFTMLQSAYQIIKQVDPTATVLGPGYEGGGFQQLDQLLAMGGQAYMDAVSFHFYIGGKPERIQILVDLVQGVLAKNNVSKPVWDTEIGFGPGDSTFTDESQMAAYFARTILLHWRDHIDRAYWYAWDNHTWSQLWMTEPDDVTLTKAGKAFSVLQSWLLGASLVSCSTDKSSLNVCTATLADGRSGEILWMANGETSFAVPSAWQATSIQDLEGNSSPLGERVRVTESPVLLR